MLTRRDIIQSTIFAPLATLINKTSVSRPQSEFKPGQTVYYYCFKRYKVISDKVKYAHFDKEQQKWIYLLSEKIYTNQHCLNTKRESELEPTEKEVKNKIGLLCSLMIDKFEEEPNFAKALLNINKCYKILESVGL
jgi:hypothetical protein